MRTLSTRMQIVCAVAAVIVAAGTVAIAHAAFAKPQRIAAIHRADAPTENRAQFQGELSGLLLKASGGHHWFTRLSCVTGGPGSWACSYVLRRLRPSCRLAFVTRLPSGEVTVQQAGRVPVNAADCFPVERVLKVIGRS